MSFSFQGWYRFRGVLSSTLIFNTLVFSLNTLASMPEKDYKAALQVAEAKVVKKASALNQAQALSASMIKQLFGRYYQVGDSWDVAAWPMNHATMRMTSDPVQLQNKLGKGGLFHYEVVEVKSGTVPQVILQVTQVQSNDFTIVDPKITRLMLTMNDQFAQSKKVYFFQNQTSGVEVSPEGVHSRVTSLELFPLDVPDVVTADRHTHPSLPTLPPQVLPFAERIHFKPNLSHCLWFEQDDFFGRPVQILWQKGDPWPTYFKTSGGIALLVQNGHMEGL